MKIQQPLLLLCITAAFHFSSCYAVDTTLTIKGTSSGSTPSGMTVSSTASFSANAVIASHGTWSVESAAAAGQTDPSSYSSLYHQEYIWTHGFDIFSSDVSCKKTGDGGQACYYPMNHPGNYRVDTLDGSKTGILARAKEIKSYFGGINPFQEEFIMSNPPEAEDFDNGGYYYLQASSSTHSDGVTYPESVTTIDSLTSQPLNISCSTNASLPAPLISCSPVNDGIKFTTSEGGELILTHFLSKPLISAPINQHMASTSKTSSGVSSMQVYAEYSELDIGLAGPPTVTYIGPTLKKTLTVTLDFQSAADASLVFPHAQVNLALDLTRVTTCTMDVPASLDFGKLNSIDSSSHELAQKTISLTASCDGEESDSVTGSATTGDLFRIGVYAPGAGEWADPVTCSDGSACIPFTDDGGSNNTGLVINNANGESVINRSDGVQLAGKLADTSNTGGTSTMDLNLIIARLQDGEQIKAGVHTARAVIKLYYN